MRTILLTLALIASPAAAQTITVAKPFADTNKDGRIDFGTANRKAYGASYVTGPIWQTAEGYQYCGPKGCDASTAAVAGAPPPADSPQIAVGKPTIVPACIDKGGSGQWTYGSAGGTFGPVCLTRTMDSVPFRASSDAPRLFQDVTVKASRNFMTTRMKSGYATISNLTARRMDITVRERGFYIRGGSHDWLIEDVKIRCAGAYGYPTGIAMGTANTPATYNIAIRRVEISDCVATGGKYQQGDGIESNRPDYRITITDSYIHDNGDGCVDLKSTATRLDNLKLERCNYGARLWGQGTAGTIRFSGNRKADIQIKPSTNWTFDRLETDGATINIAADGVGGTIAILSCNKPVKLSGAKANVTLGKGC